MSLKYLITGGCGFLGSNIAAHALSQGHQVFVIDALFRVGTDKNRDWLRSLPGGKVTIAEFDVAEQSKLDAFFKQHGPFDRIAHLAGQVAMTTSMQDPRRDFVTNVVGTFNVLEATRAYCPQAVLIYSSTNKVYGELEGVEFAPGANRYTIPKLPNGMDESLPLDFSSPYGCSKGAADQYVRDWHRNYGLNTVVFRHSSIFGGRQFSTFDQGWIGWFCEQALRQSRDPKLEPFTIAGDGKQVRDVLHADDLIALYDRAFERGKQVAGEIFNIGGGMANSLSLLELFAMLEDLLKCKLRYTQTPWRHSDQKVFVANLAKAERLLGWQPKLSAREGIAKHLEWVKASALST